MAKESRTATLQLDAASTLHNQKPVPFESFPSLGVTSLKPTVVITLNFPQSYLYDAFPLSLESTTAETQISAA